MLHQPWIKTLTYLQRLNRKTLERATLVGIALQAVLVVAGHFVPWVELHVFMFGGMMISAIAGYLYGVDSARGWGASAFGGALAGGTCGLIGIALAVVFRQTPLAALLVGTMICVLTGTVGGVFGQMAANMKKLI